LDLDLSLDLDEGGFVLSSGPEVGLLLGLVMGSRLGLVEGEKSQTTGVVGLHGRHF